MKVLQPKVISRERIFIDPDFNITRRYSSNIMPSLYKGKMPCIGFKERPGDFITNSYTGPSTYMSAESDAFLYVAPECTFSRDALRGSGFKIVRDWERANLVVLPQVEIFFNTECDIIIEYDTSALRLVDIGNKFERTATDEKLLHLKEELKKHLSGGNNIQHIWINPDLKPMSFYTINRCEMYKDIFSDDPIRARFCFEHEIRIVPTLEINPELFTIWKKCNDRDVLKCAVQQVDWQKYPITLAWFLNSYCPYVYIGANSYLKNILDTIGFTDLRAGNKLNKEVSPEDWNMLQKCEMYFMGLPEQGGFVDATSVTIPKCVRSRVAVKPIYIDEPQNFEDLMQVAKNN